MPKGNPFDQTVPSPQMALQYHHIGGYQVHMLPSVGSRILRTPSKQPLANPRCFRACEGSKTDYDTALITIAFACAKGDETCTAKTACYPAGPMLRMQKPLGGRTVAVRWILERWPACVRQSKGKLCTKFFDCPSVFAQKG